MTKTLIAMVGLPRSGKSTIVKTLRKDFGAPIVSRDCLRLAVHGQRYAPAAEPLIKSLDVYMIRALFLAGHDLVIADETNYSTAAREHLKDSGWTTVFYEVPTLAHVCQERAIDTNQPDLVPVIDEMVRRWEPLNKRDFRWTETNKTRCSLIFANDVDEIELFW